MLFPIEQLLEKREPPLIIYKESTVQEALRLMLMNNYSQLPVVNKEGDLIGLISESTIANTYFYIGASLSLLEITVDNCMTSPKTISPDSDIFDALNLLDDVYAVVVVKNQKPVGILTDYDTTHFFRDLSEGLIIIEDIEVTLRKYMEAVLSTDNLMDAALMRAFKENKKNQSRPAKEYNELSFGEHIQLIITDENWEKFNDYFAPKVMFTNLMGEVGNIRNQLAHFRGRLEPIQLNALITGRNWLESRPKHRSLVNNITGRAEITLEDMKISSSATVSGKYDSLLRWLTIQREDGVSRLRVGFNQIESLINQELPESARQHRSWWANDPATHSQAHAWVTAGWVVDDVDFNTEEVNFRHTSKAHYYSFFSDLLARLKTIRPGITQTQKVSLDNWLSFSSGIVGFSFGWVLPKEPIFRVELYIDKGEKDANKAAFEELEKQKAEIEAEIGEKLNWSPLAEARASRIYASMPFGITDPPEKHEIAKKWGMEMMLKFIDVFRPRLRNL